MEALSARLPPTLITDDGCPLSCQNQALIRGRPAGVGASSEIGAPPGPLLSCSIRTTRGVNNAAADVSGTRDFLTATEALHLQTGRAPALNTYGNYTAATI